MRRNTKLGCLLMCVAMLAFGCSPEPAEPADVATPEPEIAATPEPPPVEETPAADVEPPAPAQDPAPPPTPAPEPPKATPAPIPTPEPDEPEKVDPRSPVPDPQPDPEPTPEPEPLVVDVGGVVEVAAAKAGLTRIGSNKCKICHKVQFASWAESAHGLRTPPLDCESCHGAGSEYKTKKVMEDPQLARAAGLVIPDRSFCSQCHTSGWTDDLLTRTHAHKDEGS